MKILHLVSVLDYCGGVESYLLALLPELAARGCAQVVAYGRGDAGLVPRSHRVESLGTLGAAAANEARRSIRRLLQAERPDVVHAHNITNFGAIDASMGVAPTVATAHGYQFICPASDLGYDRTEEICERSCGAGCFAVTLFKKCLSWNPKNAWLLYRRCRWAIRHAGGFSCIIAPSQYTGARYVRAGFPEERIRVLPYFCPVEPATAPRNEPAVPTLMFLGRLRRYKGYHHFIKALGLVGPPVRGIIVGDVAGSEGEIGRLAREAGCLDRLELRPWIGRESVASAMEQATLLVFPSLVPETLGIVGLEALARGVPVVASDVGGVREWLINGQTGLLVPPANARAIAEAVNRLLDSPHLRLAMGHRGIELITQKFNCQSHVSRLVGIYQEAAGRGAGSCVRESVSPLR